MVIQLPNAEIKNLNDIQQITTHFGTFTENDSDYYLYDDNEQIYKIYNEIEGYTYYYNLEGEIIGINNGNDISGGGFS